MPSEPLEAEFAEPPALSPETEEQFRELEQEGPPHFLRSHLGHGTIIDSRSGHGGDLEGSIPEKGIILVEFEKGAAEDPREWGRAKKWYVTMTVSFLCLSVAMGSSIVTGDLQSPVIALHSTQEIINLTVACFVIGFGIGPLLFAPLSETVGRKPIYSASLFLYFIFTLPAALAENAATLVISRQIAGLAASAPMCNVGGSVADIWAVEERGIPMAVFSATIFMGPCVGPLLGGWIGQYAGWRWIYWVLFMSIGGCFLLTLFIPETLAPVILRHKSAALREKTGDQSYRTREELEREPFAERMKVALIRPLVMMVCEPIVLFMSIYLSFVYGLLYLLFFAFPIAFGEIRGFSLGMTGVTFISIIIGILLAMCCMPFQEKMYRQATIANGGAFPEARLYPMMIGSFILPTALFIFGFTGAYEHVNFMGPCVAGTLFGFAMIFLYVSANSYIVDSYSAYAASAIAAKTLLRSEVGASVPFRNHANTVHILQVRKENQREVNEGDQIIYDDLKILNHDTYYL